MSTFFVLLFGLFEISVSVPDCEWAYIGGEFIGLNICQQYWKQNENAPGSYVIECNEKNDGLQNKYFIESETCDASTPSYIDAVTALTAHDEFNCNNNDKVRCNNHLYLIYRTYACLPNSTSYSYRDYNLLTNTCLGDPKTQTSQYIHCSSTSYTITTYSGIQCQDMKKLNTETIENNDCTEIIYCSETIDSTTYFTTTTKAPKPNTNPCKFINYDGAGHRIDECSINSISDDIYSYQYQCNYAGDSVVYNYYYNTTQCDNDPLISMLISDENVIDFECETAANKTCKASDYMQLRVFTVAGGCNAADLITFDEHRMSEYAVVDVVVDQCLQFSTGHYCMYSCTNNHNHQNNGEWSITYYDDANCAGDPLPHDTLTYNDIDCYNHRVSHLIWCDGINNLSYNDTEAQSYIIDCNYFIDDYIGKPLGICADHIIGGKHFSFQYKCNAFKSGIEKLWYKNAGCKSNKLEWIEFTDYDEFYCDSSHTCENMLVAKHYTNTSCNASDDFYYVEHMLVDECWPVGNADADYLTYAKVTCDDTSYITSLYTKEDCDQNAQFRSIPYDINDVCLWSHNHLQVEYCPHWMNASYEAPVIAPTPAPIYDDSTDCQWINMNGNARRIGVCNMAPYGDIKWSYMYRCRENGNVVQSWYTDSDDCGGEIQYERNLTEQVTSYNCESDNICDHYVRIMTYDSENCEEEEEKFVTSESVIDACFTDDYNESTLIKCNPNGNGYIIYEYHDEYCHDEYLWKVSPVQQKLCQPNTQRVEIVEECIGVSASDREDINIVNYTECNYFYNGLFGVPVNVCHAYKKGDHYTSVMYKCNEANDAIIQYQYDGADCEEEAQIGADDTSYGIFYCDAEETCDDVDILQMKWYENDSCTTDENYWAQSTALMNICWPNIVDNTSAVILCDADNYVYYRYSNMFCNEPVLSSIEYQSGDCVDGNIFAIESGCLECHYWISSDGYGYPIDYCYEIMDSSSSQHEYHSFKFKCNSKYNGIQQIWYKDNACLDEEEETETQAIASDNLLDIKYAEPLSAAFELLTFKLYHNDACEKDENNWSQDIVVIDECLQTKEGDSRMVSCSSRDGISSFMVHTFKDANCTQTRNESSIESGDCDENGAKIEIISCGVNTLSPTSNPIAITSSASYPKLSFAPSTQQEKEKELLDLKALNMSKTCVNFFGGSDVGGMNCKIIEALLWLMITVGVVTIACCCAFAFCSNSVRNYCYHGPWESNKDFDDGDTSDYEEDLTRDHQRGIMINASGLHNRRSARKASIVSATTDSDTDPLMDDEIDEQILDPLDENIHALAISSPPSAPNVNTISSFNPGVSGSGSGAAGSSSSSQASHHIASSEDDLMSTKRMNSSNPHTMSSAAGAAEVHIHHEHMIPAHFIGRTIEIDSIPIDIMAGVDMTAMHHPIGSPHPHPQRVPSMSSSQPPSPPKAPQIAAGHIPLQASETDVQRIVAHYSRRESLFNSTDTATNITDNDNNNNKSSHAQHSRSNAMDLVDKKTAEDVSRGVLTSALAQTLESQTPLIANDMELKDNNNDDDDDDDKEESKEIFHRERHVSDTEEHEHRARHDDKGVIISALGASHNDSSRTRTYAVDEHAMRMDDTICTYLDPNELKDDIINHDSEDPPSKSPMQDPLNQLIAHGSCGGLHKHETLLSPGTRYRLRTLSKDDDDDSDDSDDSEEQRLASLPKHDRITHNTMHVANNSLIDPMIRTPISHGALMHSEDDDDDDNSVDSGTLTSALAHSVNTGIHVENDGDNDADDEDVQYYEAQHGSSNGTVHDL